MAEINEDKVPVNQLKQRFEEAKKARQKYETHWDKAKKFYDSKQWEGIPKIAWHQSEPVFNKVFEFVEIMRGYLADNRWGVDSIPATYPEGADEKTINEFAEKVNHLLDFLWTDNRMQNKLAQVLQYVFLYGTGFMKATFDPENISVSGVGQIITEVLDPYFVYPDPYASDIYDASFIVEHHPVSLRWALERYPDKRQELLQAGEGSTTESTAIKGTEGSRSTTDVSEGKALDIFEHWYKDSAIIEDEDGNSVPKYQTGIRRTVITGGGLVLEDGEALYNQFPYVRFVEIPRPCEFFGDCTVHKALGIQQTINQLLRSIIDNGLWLIHGIWVVDSTSGVTPKSLSGYAPRDAIVKNPGTEVRRDAGVSLPPHVMDTLIQQTEAFDRVVGIPDVLRGVVPSRQPVQTTMMQQESGEVRTRERQRRVEESLADLGKLWLDIVGEHWSDTRVVRNKKSLGGFDMFQISKKDFEDWRWDVHVVPGSTGPMDRAAMMTTMVELANNLGVVIPPAFAVKIAGIPGLEAAMLEAENALAAQAEAEQQAQPMPTEAMPPEEPMVPEEQMLQMLGEAPPMAPEGEDMALTEDILSQLTPEEQAAFAQMG